MEIGSLSLEEAATHERDFDLIISLPFMEICLPFMEMLCLISGRTSKLSV